MSELGRTPDGKAERAALQRDYRELTLAQRAEQVFELSRFMSRVAEAGRQRPIAGTRYPENPCGSWRREELVSDLRSESLFGFPVREVAGVRVQRLAHGHQGRVG